MKKLTCAVATSLLVSSAAFAGPSVKATCYEKTGLPGFEQTRIVYDGNLPLGNSELRGVGHHGTETYKFQVKMSGVECRGSVLLNLFSPPVMPVSTPAPAKQDFAQLGGKGATQDASQGVAQDASQGVAQDASQGAAQDASQGAAQESAKQDLVPAAPAVTENDCFAVVQAPAQEAQQSAKGGAEQQAQQAGQVADQSQAQASAGAQVATVTAVADDMVEVILSKDASERGHFDHASSAGLSSMSPSARVGIFYHEGFMHGYKPVTVTCDLSM